MSKLNAKEYQCFESIKRIRKDGTEYWHARELMAVLEYSKWENFAKVINKAKIAAKVLKHVFPISGKHQKCPMEVQKPL